MNFVQSFVECKVSLANGSRVAQTGPSFRLCSTRCFGQRLSINFALPWLSYPCSMCYSLASSFDIFYRYVFFFLLAVSSGRLSKNTGESGVDVGYYALRDKPGGCTSAGFVRTPTPSHGGSHAISMCTLGRNQTSVTSAPRCTPTPIASSTTWSIFITWTTELAVSSFPRSEFRSFASRL
jgi:hypothetical protein